MSASSTSFYAIGILLVLLGIAFILIPLAGRSLSNVKIPWIILYTYNSGGFYFATSPILIIISLVGILAAIFHR